MKQVRKFQPCSQSKHNLQLGGKVQLRLLLWEGKRKGECTFKALDCGGTTFCLTWLRALTGNWHTLSVGGLQRTKENSADCGSTREVVKLQTKQPPFTMIRSKHPLCVFPLERKKKRVEHKSNVLAFAGAVWETGFCLIWCGALTEQLYFGHLVGAQSLVASGRAREKQQTFLIGKSHTQAQRRYMLRKSWKDPPKSVAGLMGKSLSLNEASL